MGILNVTPDSFAEPSPTLDIAVAIERALQMQEGGADIIDVGGESTRPGTESIGASEELARVLPVIKGLSTQVRIPISVDTYRAEVAQAAIDEGASIVNDISGLRYDPALAGVVARSGAALVLMHMRGRPKDMYAEAVYADVVAEVAAELRTSIDDRDRRGCAVRTSDRRPRSRVCQTAGRQLWCAGQAVGAGRGARSSAAGRAVAEVVHAGGVRRPGRAGTRLGDGRGGDRSGPRGRAHRPRPRGGGDGSGRASGRRNPEARRMTWLTAVLRRPPISWWDIADIAVVSLIIYEMLMLIRGTRAVQMALGGGIVVGLFYLSGWSHLETVNFLIRNFVGYVVFAVIVLFQADIRRALAHLGRAPFFRYFATEESAEESIEELIVAAGLLSAKRIGAIVAIERQVGLAELHRGRNPSRWRADLRPAGQHFSAIVAAA